jgi:beta-mannosidase
MLVLRSNRFHIYAFKNFFILFSLQFLMIQSGLGQTFNIPLIEGWNFHQIEENTIRKAAVPGSIHTDLLQHQLIKDPFYRDNALYLGWIDSTSWVYEYTLSWPEGWEEMSNINLVFDGLDTYADVYFNETLVLQADNMFRQWTIPIARDEWGKAIHIRVVFHSTVLKGKEKADNVIWTYPADSDSYPGKPSVFTRKAPYQFGWDFAPPMPGCGIWKPVRLEGWQGHRLRDVWLETKNLQGNQASLLLHGSLEADRAQQIYMYCLIGQVAVYDTIDVQEGLNSFEIPLQLVDPKLWWPRGSGQAHLYSVAVFARSNNVLDSLVFQAGIRTIQLDQTPDSLGTPFRFIVNGRPVFVKGANWVPADMFPARVNRWKYTSLLEIAAEANMNMLRIWGGGIYEADVFYELADSLGIMVWQDFMFAGTMYPGDTAFLSSVKSEATDQIKRLRQHPSIALWCGNNEIAVAWKNWGWQQKYQYTPGQMAQMVDDYQRLFEDILPGLVHEYHPGTDYLASSPISNWGDKADMAKGNNHFWGVWHGEMDLDSLETWVPRFMTEYGMQSLPMWESIQDFTAPQDWSMNSPVMAFHQRSYKGNRLIKKYIEMEGLGPVDDFKTFVSLGHQVQRIALGKAIDAHMKAFPYCMGTLLWQLNEPWPGASWSIIDYYGRKKPGYKVVKEKYLEK